MVAAPENYLTLYKGPGRGDFLNNTRDAGPFFDPVTKAWIVTNPEIAREMLSSSNLVPALVVESQTLPDGLAERLAGIIDACEHIPLFLSGESHAVLRRRFSEQIASRRAEVSQWMEQDLPAYVEPFRRPGRFDVVAEVIEPMVRGLMQIVVGMTLPTDLELIQTSLVFDKFSSVSRRARVASMLTKLHNHVREVMGPEATEEDVGVRFGLIVVARDATAGTFGESLVRLLSDANGRPLNQIAFPKFAPQTGVPYVDRVAEAAFTAAGIAFESGARFRIVLQTYSHSPPDQHHRFFGAGLHSCVGRSTATELWSGFGALLGHLSSCVRVLSYELEENNFVFNVAKRFEVEVTT